MQAAVVASFDFPPRFDSIETPEATRPTEMVVDVLAAGLHPRVRSQAAGSHYTSTDELPLIPGVDGVGRGADGVLRYFILPDTTRGSMAEKTVIDTRRSVVLPEGTDPVAVAAAMNPAMSSWIALRQRITFEPGQNVLVIGATGSAGQMAVQIAALFGAGKVVAAGRNAETLTTLPALGATHTVQLEGSPAEVAARLAETCADVDVVIDYVWGETMPAVLTALVESRADESRPLTWIEIGSLAGPTATVPSAAHRACRLQIVGSGQGSVSPSEIVAELPALAAEITRGTFDVSTRVVPLADVETAWTAPAVGNERLVVVP